MSGAIRTSTVAELFVGDLAAIGNWVVANVRSSVAWPLQVEVVEFRGCSIFRVPRSTTTAVANGSTLTMYPFAAVNLPAGTAFKDGQQLLSYFLSSLSWVEGAGITVEHWSGGSRAHPMGESPMAGLVTNHFELEYLPDPTDQRARWALAFYREGLSLERSNVAYATLSFFKILNIVAGTGLRQKKWMNSNVSDFGSHSRMKSEVDSRIAELKSSGITDIGEYLYASCRCAVAHAGMNPTIDPENLDDMERLSKDLPLIRAMAVHVIEKELNVKSHDTVWREHFYELAGFKQILGAELIAQITRGDKPDETKMVDVPTMNVQIQGKAPYGPLSNINPVRMGCENGVIHLVLESPDKRGQIGFRLDFPQERLHFELSEDLVYRDDGTPDSAEAVAEVKRFYRDYFGNGRLHVYNADTGAPISRKDAFLPMNMWLDFAESEREIACWRKLADLRRQRAASVDNEILQWSDPYFLSVAVSFNFNCIG
jgi:hypothetical protein